MGTILFSLSSPYLDLVSGLMKKDLSLSLNCLVRFSIIFCSVMSLVSNISRLHPSPLYQDSRSRSHVTVSTAVILSLADSVLASFIFLSIYVLRSSCILTLMHRICSSPPSSWALWYASASSLSLMSLTYPFVVVMLQFLTLGVVGIDPFYNIMEL